MGVDMRMAPLIAIIQSAFTRHALTQLCRIGATLIETLKKAEDFLGEKGVASPRLEAQLLFAHFLKLRRIDLFTQPERPLNPDELVKLREALKQKISGKPTAYILGEKEFYGRIFTVDGAVLIPRPETEELVEHVLKEVSTANHIVDLGTGSGCIGVTLAAELKVSRLTLVDISESALTVARKNAGQTSGITTVCADFTAENFLLSEKADLVVSNPPYVLPQEHGALEPGVRDFEPRLALVADDFEKLHQRLIATARRNLLAGGLLAIETHPQKSHEVAGWFKGQGFVSVEIRNDFSGRPHFVFGRRA